MEFLETNKPTIQGHVLIRDPKSNQILLDRHNAIHSENMSLAIGYALANNNQGFIHSMSFGNGGSAVSGTGAITYFPTNTTDSKADLYDPTYNKVIDNTTSNYIQVNHVLGTTYTDVIVTVTLDYNEPAGQAAFDDVTDLNSSFAFDEIGLKNVNGLLLTHVIFNPILKSQNRLIEVVYTLRIQMS